MNEREARVREIREREQAATAGPWHLFTNRHPTTHGKPWGVVESKRHPAGGAGQQPAGMNTRWEGEDGKANATFIAHSRSDIPFLLDEVERLRAGLAFIGENRCGIPGHAVAVGCGSSVMARDVLDGATLRKCEDCSGGAIWFTDERNVYRSRPCDTCERRGYLSNALSTT